MTDHTLPAQPRLSAAPVRSGTSLARWAFGLAAAAPGAIAAALVLFGVADAVGGSGATSDNWVGVLVGIGLFAGLLASLAGFALAVVAKVKHQPWLALWLPLSVFPALFGFFVLGEAFWWE